MKARHLFGVLAAMGYVPPPPLPAVKAPLRLDPAGPPPVQPTRAQIADAKARARREVSARKVRRP
jgi:hypothetical protein